MPQLEFEYMHQNILTACFLGNVNVMGTLFNFANSKSHEIIIDYDEC